MSIAGSLEQLTSDITTAYQAIDGKGGTIPEYKNTENLGDSIASIPSGGGMPQPTYGRIWYGDLAWVKQYAENCDVSVDNEKLTEYLAEHPLQWEDMMNFDYDGNGHWSSWDFEEPISDMTTEDLATQLGITVSLESGAEWANFSLQSGADFSNLHYIAFDTLSDYNNGFLDENGPITVGNVSVDRKTVRKYEYGSEPTSIPDNFLANCRNLREFTAVPEGVVSIGDNFFKYAGEYGHQNEYSKIILPTTLRTIGDNFILGAGSFYKWGITIPNGVTSIGANAMNSGNSGGLFNQPIALPDSITSMGSGFCNNDFSFNQPIAIPKGLTTLTNWFSYSTAFNQPIYLPPTITRIEGGFAYFNRMTSTIYVGNLSPDIVVMSDRRYFLCANGTDSPAYQQGIKIIGANRQAWLDAFPNISSGYGPRRKLVDGGY